MSATPSFSDIYNFRQASPDLASSGQPREHQLAAIAAAGYNVIINLALQMIRDIHFLMKRHRYERWVSSTSIFQCNSARLPNQTWKGSLRRWSNTPPSAFGFIAPRICAYQPFSDCIERCARDGRSHRPLRSCMRSGSLIRCGPSSSGRSLPEHVARSTAPNADDNRRAFSQRGAPQAEW